MKEKIFIEKVADLFLENGAKTLTMDDIAKEFGMSKKTLYKEYETKEALLEEVLKHTANRVLEEIKVLGDQFDNAIERMLCRDTAIVKASTSNESLLLKQLIKYYPHIFNKHILNFSEKFSVILVHNIEKGREQGLYRTNFDPEFYGKLFFQLSMSYYSPYLDITNITKFQYLARVLDFYLNAITTPKGKAYMKTLDLDSKLG